MRRLAQAAIIATVAVSVLASLDPEGPVFAVVRRLPGRDITGHFLWMAGLAFCVALGFAAARLRGRVLGMVGATAVLTLAVTLEELLQIALPHRVFDWNDLAASWAGIATGALGAAIVARLADRRPRKPAVPGPDSEV